MNWDDAIIEIKSWFKFIWEFNEWEVLFYVVPVDIVPSVTEVTL